MLPLPARTVIAIAALATLAACASRTASTSSAPAPAPAAAAPAPAPAPVTGRLAQIKPDMEPMKVQELIGKPTSETNYETGRRWIPFANLSGQDHRRMEWLYGNEGTVVFTLNSYSGQWRVLEVRGPTK